MSLDVQSFFFIGFSSRVLASRVSRSDHACVRARTSAFWLRLERISNLERERERRNFVFFSLLGTGQLYKQGPSFMVILLETFQHLSFLGTQHTYLSFSSTDLSRLQIYIPYIIIHFFFPSFSLCFALMISIKQKNCAENIYIYSL